MKTSTIKQFLFLLTLLAIVGGCEKDAPASVYNENTTFSSPPVVNSIVPENMPYILGGITTVVINGTGFPVDTSKVHVFFNNSGVKIGTVTATQIKLTAPNMIQDSIRVRVSVAGSDKFSALKYIDIRSAFILIKEIDTTKYAPAAITFNKNGDLFTSVVTKAGSSDGIYQLSSTGTLTQFALPSQGALAAEPLFSGMKFRGDSVYAARRARIIVSKNNVTGAMNIFRASFPSTQLPTPIEDFDYDAKKFLWAGGTTLNGGILRIDSNKNVTVFPYAGKIQSVRVYNNALYVSGEEADSSAGVYKIPIDGSDNLGTPEKFFDLTGTVGNKFTKTYGITFDSQGNLYVGTDAPVGIYVVATDKSFQPLYNGVIGPSCKYLAWGKDAYLYVVREKATSASSPTGIFKIDMLGKLSAPYYGQ